MFFRYFKNQCPRCKKTAIFTGIYRMNSKCPTCGNVFEKEPGYYIGAMIASYFLGAFIALPTLLLATFAWGVEMLPAVGITSAQVFLIQPILFRYSRILWINIEADLTKAIHPEDPKS